MEISMKRTFITIAGLCLGMLAAPCFAQSSDFERALSGPSMEARIGITIPFGGDKKSESYSPQLTLIGRRTDSGRASIDWAVKPSLGQTDYVETRLSLTLTGEPQLQLNGSEIYGFEAEDAYLSDGVKTAGKVALVAGAVAVVVVGVAVVGLFTSGCGAESCE
jgi:hypothetical protein